jgi:hypothetical protein
VALLQRHTGDAAHDLYDNKRVILRRCGRSSSIRRVGDTFVVVAIGPEALVDRRRFDRAVRAAAQRLTEVEE